MLSSRPEHSDEPPGLLRTLVAFFAGAWLGSLFHGREKVNPHGPTGELDKQDQNREQTRVHVVAIEPYPSPTPSDKEKAYRTRKEFREWVLFGVEILGLVGLYMYVRTTHRMWFEMTRQTSEQRNTTISSQRAWVGVKNNVFRVNETKKMSEWVVSYEAQNSGKSPAIGVVFFSEVKIGDWETKWNSSRLCVPPAIESRNRQGTHIVIFPDSSVPNDPNNVRSAFAVADFSKSQKHWIFSCIAYRDAFEAITKATHTTRILYSLDQSRIFGMDAYDQPDE